MTFLPSFATTLLPFTVVLAMDIVNDLRTKKIAVTTPYVHTMNTYNDTELSFNRYVWKPSLLM